MTWLPPLYPEATITPWTGGTLVKSWSHITRKAERVASSVGEGPDFRGKKVSARALLRHGDIAAIERACAEDPRLHRAITSVWAEDEELTGRTLRMESLDAVFANTRLNRMTTNTLITVLLRDFTRLQSRQQGLFDELTRRIRASAARLEVSARARTSLLKSVQEHPEWILDSRAPTTVATHLASKDLDVDGFLTAIGARASGGSTYAQGIRHALYLEQLRALDPAMDNRLLKVISEPDVFRAPTADGGYFGHQLLEVLCAPAAAPGDTWRDSILRIAGDPRLTHTRQFATWWSSVDPKIRSKVTGWLSSEDLRLFLAAVENFAHANGNDDILRMFPARKYFLEGLLDDGRVRETRLFMGTSALTHLKASLGRNVLSDIAPLSGQGAPDTSVIFVDCGDFHLVEGSHNFKLWIYYGRPGRIMVDRRRHSFTLSQFRNEVPIDFLSSRGLSKDESRRSLLRSRWHASFTHNAKWQQNTLAALKEFNINLDPTLLMNSQTYEKYRRSVGPSPVRTTYAPNRPRTTRRER